LLPRLPRSEHYHILFMERDLEDVIASQNAMLARQQRRGAQLDSIRLLETYRAQLDRVRTHLSCRPEVRLLSVSYAQLLTNAAAGVKRIAEFLGSPFDQDAAKLAIRPELRRHGRSANTP
jgi:hypothetical protein